MLLQQDSWPLLKVSVQLATLLSFPTEAWEEFGRPFEEKYYTVCKRMRLVRNPWQRRRCAVSIAIFHADARGASVIPDYRPRPKKARITSYIL